MWTEELINRQASLMAAGWTSMQVATETGMSQGAVLGIARRDKRLSLIGWSTKPGDRVQRSRNVAKDASEAVARLGGPKTDEARAYDCSSMRLPLHELEHNQCRWIVEGEGENALYCGHKRRAKSILSFCGHHVTRATR